MTTAGRGATGKSAKSSSKKRDWRIGEIAVFNRLLDRARLEECLAIQADMAGRGFPMKLGKILIEKFYIDRQSLAALLKAQAASRGKDPAKADTSADLIKFTPVEHEILVERVREQKLIGPEQVDECFDLQMALEEHGIDKQLGEIMIEKAYLSRDLVSDILDRHQVVKKSLVQGMVLQEDDQAEAGTFLEDTDLLEAVKGRVEPESIRESRKLRFGRLVEEKGLASREAVKECLYVQFRLKELGVIKRIGELMVEKGHLRPPDVRRVLQLQKQRLGKIRWSELARSVEITAEDRQLSRILVENGVLSQDEVDECRFVQRALQDLGLSRSLAQVMVEKEYVDRKLLDGIVAEAKALELAQAAHGQGGAKQPSRSASLDMAYKEILGRSRDSQDGEGTGGEGSGEEGRRTSKSQDPLRSAATRPGRRWVLWTAAGLVLAAGVGAVLWIMFAGDDSPEGGGGDEPAPPPTARGKAESQRRLANLFGRAKAERAALQEVLDSSARPAFDAAAASGKVGETLLRVEKARAELAGLRDAQAAFPILSAQVAELLDELRSLARTISGALPEPRGLEAKAAEGKKRVDSLVESIEKQLKG